MVKIGRSKFTIGLLSGFLIGAFCAKWFYFNGWFYIASLVILVGLLSYFWPRIIYRWVLFCILGLFLGLSYYYFYNLHQARHQLVFNQKVEVRGEILEPPKIKPTKLQAILGYKGNKILVDLPRYPEYAYGDMLKFTAEIQDPKSLSVIDNFDYGQYLLDKNIRGLVKNTENIEKTGNQGQAFYKYIFLVSQKFQNILAQVLPEPYASFQSGLILGNRTTQIPDSLTSAFNRTGTTHIVAVSGYNVTIIISILALCFALISRKFSFWATLICIIIFVIMTGGSASVMRAGILGGLAAWGRLEGRRINHLILLLVVAFTMLLFNPYQIRGDVSFQLSFLAFAGLIYISPILSNIKIMAKVPDIIKTVMAETLGAQIAVMPIIIYNFGIISLVAPLVNILVLPLVPLSMLLGFLTGIGGMIWLYLGQILANIAWFILKYIIVIVESFARLNWAAVVYKTNEWWWIPLYYILTLLLINFRKSEFKVKQHLKA